MAIVARAQITLTDSYDALSILLDNESHLIPTDANGGAFPNSYTGCASTVSVFQGTLDITSQYNITVPAVTGITGSLSGTTYTVTDMTLDDGSVVFTATHKTDVGGPVLERHFSLSKNKRADSARFYQLRTSDNLIQRDGLTKELSPPNILLAGYLREGEQAEVSQTGYFVVYEQTRVAMTVEEYTALVQAAQAVPGEEYILSQLPYPYVERYRSATALPFLDYAVQTDAMSIRVEWYEDADYTKRLDVQTITVSSDGLTLYTWVMYADDSLGTGISATSTGKRYVGFAENQTVSAPGNDPSVYTWSPLYDNVKVGAKNLVLLADKTKTTTAYLANTYTLTEKMVADEDYTLTLKGTLAPGQTGWNIYLNTTATALTSLPYQAGSVVYTGHFNGKTLADAIHTLQVYNYPNNTSSATIEWIQLEKGNIATGFKVAPEDLALEFSQLDSAVTTLTDTTLPALEDGLLTKAEKTGIQTSADIVAAEKKDIDAAYNALYSNENLVVKTVISTPKGTYNTAYTNLTTAIATVMNAPDGVALPAGAVAAARSALSAYADKLALLRTAMQTAQKTIEAQIQTETQNSLSAALQGYVDNVTYGTDKQALQNQVDKSITTWFGEVEPTLANNPASTWPLTTDKDVHLGDIYYNTLTGYAYRFLFSASIYAWMKITDSDIMLALANAETAQDTADGKRRVFVAQPVAPYDIGDLWTQGTSGDLMRCKTSKPEGGAYAAGDWEKASKYTDDTAVNNLEIGGRNLMPKSLITTYGGGTLDTAQYPTIGRITYSRPAVANEGFYIDRKTVMEDVSDYIIQFDAQLLSGSISSVTFYNTLGHTFDVYCDGVLLGTTTSGDATHAIPLTDGLKHSFLVKIRTKVGMTAGSYSYLGTIIQFNKTIATAFNVELTRFQLERGSKATDWTQAPEDNTAAIAAAQSAAQSYATNYITTNVQPQIDGKMESFAQDTDPSLVWTTTELKNLHTGDLWYHPTNKITKRWSGTAWVTLADAEAQAAASLAATKRQVFVTSPTGPYAIGDLWVQGTTGDLMRCVTASTVNGSAYTAGHWTKAVKYTDDTIASAANTAAGNAQTTANTAVTNAGLAQTAANTANTSITDIISDDKLTGNEKPEVRKEWNILVSAAILNSTQAGTFGVSATAYQNAIAALGLYLNNNVAFTYANATAGTIPSWIADVNLGVTTTIVGATYRATWKTYYDANVSLLNAIATKAKALADAAQDTADNLEFGGRNIVKHAAIVSYNTSTTSYLEDTNVWNLSVASGMTRAGFALSGTTVRIPYGRTYVLSFEVFCPFATTWSMDINNYPVSGSGWVVNDNDNTSLRKQSPTAVAANQWVKCWYGFTNTNVGNTLKVDLYDGSNFGINNTSGATANFQIRNVKGELGTKPTEWTPAPEDVQAKITASNTNLNSLRQSMDNTKAIRLGMKIGYSSFSTVASGYLYLCGLQLNPTTFVEELADVNGSLYGSFYNSATGVVEPRVTIAVAKQAVNLNGVALGTTGYLIWDNTAKAVWFAHFIKTMGADKVVTAEYWNKRNVGKVGDNTELVLDASTYVIGELEI